MTLVKRLAFVIALLSLLPWFTAQLSAQTQTVPAIPGLTAPDPFPGGCVDCHVDPGGGGVDHRLSTAMRRWYEGVDPELLALSQRYAPAGVTLTGRHPRAEASLRNIPQGCMPCHGRNARNAPPFPDLLHAIHLVGDAGNDYLTIFQGHCMNCHKFNANTAKWSVPSGSEK